jgi:ABC-type lipoprotein release transport system permease subunit
MKNGSSSLWQTISIGFYLAVRDVRKANIWTTMLIVAVMVLTFINLVVVSGVLIGLIQASSDANRSRYAGDVIVSTLPKKKYIERSVEIETFIKAFPGVEAITSRYIEGGHLEANYKNRTRISDAVDKAGGLVVGINPRNEHAVTKLDTYMVTGAFLDYNDTDSIVVGKNLLYKYAPIDSPGLSTLKNIGVGDKVRLVIGSTSREVTIRGVMGSKVGENETRIYMLDTDMRKIIGRTDYNVDEISVKLSALAPASTAGDLATALRNQGYEDFARIQTWDQSEPKFLKDIKATFGLLGDLISTIGLVVACITIFIIIFVNAITRRRYIGILKGIGIRTLAIECSYVFQSLFYATAGIIIGTLGVFLFLKPYIAAHPINFPFSDGILVATLSGTAIRAAVLLVATLIAGYIPARMVVKQNTLDAILGR